MNFEQPTIFVILGMCNMDEYYSENLCNTTTEECKKVNAPYSI